MSVASEDPLLRAVADHDPGPRGALHPGGHTGAPGLADLRRAARMTQRELALYLGVSVRTVAYWEAGTHPVPLGAARSLARLLRRPLPRIVEAAGLPAPRVPDPRTWRPEDLGTVVAALRRSAGWSAAGLGRRLGMSRWTVRRWESGTTRPSMSACRRMEDVFRLPRGSLTHLCGQATVSGTTDVQGSGGAADGARTGADRWRAEDPRQGDGAAGRRSA